MYLAAVTVLFFNFFVFVKHCRLLFFYNIFCYAAGSPGNGNITLGMLSLLRNADLMI